ncbi:MAG: FKBP-type peptidyl-prolyl cis-trans isomerase [Actinobacteria bacterium]|nr:FKBP-type peptidyl-prolyl cis-trans isomerase [Actinomycetota bacterium]
MRSPRLRLLAAVAAPIILLTACGGDEGADGADNSSATSAGPDDAATTSPITGGDLADVGVETTEGEDGTEVPGLTLEGAPFADGDLPFGVEATESKSLTEGDGAKVTSGQEVTVRYLAVNGSNGEELLSTFPTEDTVAMNLGTEGLLPAFVETLPKQKVGSELILAMPPAEGFGEQGNPSLGIGPADTVLFYMEIVDAVDPLSQAEGTTVEPPAGLPTVEADGTSPAQITVPEGEDPPGELVVQPLIEGERATVEAGQSITVHYTGVKWSDGEQFESSYTAGQPFTTTIGAGQVIPGWDEGLVGQPVGSRVLLVIPPAQAYGEAPSGDDAAATATADPNANPLAGETLVFVIDILSAN